MANIRELDPGASPLHYFGAELRRLRDAAGLTLDQLGKIVFLTGSMIGQIETATKTPKDEHIPRLDAALGADGALVRAWELARRSRLPGWYQRIAQMEATVDKILVFQATVVHGLLQTDGYARAVLGVMHPEDLDIKVEARLARQEILKRAEPPMLWVVLAEAVLHQEIGGKAVMRTQLEHLLSFRRCESVQIQVLPFTAGAHAGMTGSFTIFSFDDQADVAYSEGYEDGGWAVVNSKEVKARWLRYDLLRAAALSPEDSADLIHRVMEERYEQRPGPGRRPVA
ncbi:helix-turn-helix domain-containing protein [Streptomyces sp. SYSU K217416]